MGQMVSLYPSASMPESSIFCDPWPEKWKKSTSPLCAPATSHWQARRMLSRVYRNSQKSVPYSIFARWIHNIEDFGEFGDRLELAITLIVSEDDL